MIYGTWGKRRNSMRLLMLLGFMLMLGLPFSVDAAPVGKVTYLEGNVDATPTGGKAQILKLNDPVNIGDILRTKSRSKVEVTFTDGNILRLAESTRLRVTQYAPGENQKSYLNLLRGKTQSIVGALKKGSQYEIHTPTAICGVRGTNFFSFFINGVSGSVFQEGSGYGYNPNFPQDVKQIAAGETILVTHENAPPVVRPATALELEKHLKDTAPPQEKDKKEEGKQETPPAAGAGAPPPAPPDSQPPAPPAGSPLGSNPVPPYQPPVLIPLPTPPTPAPDPTPPTPTPTSGAIGIQSAAVTGTNISLAGTLTSPTAPSAGTLSNVLLSDGSPFSGYVAGVPGSWNGAIRGIYRNANDYIGLVSGTLTGAITGTNLSASGPISAGEAFGSVSNYPAGAPMSSFDFPVYQFKTIDGSFPLYTYEQEPAGVLTGYNTTAGGVLAVWGIANTGTYNNPAHATLSADQWASYAWGSHILHSLGISLTDDGVGHTALTGQISYMDTRYRGVAGLHYLGSYDAAGVYKTAGAGYYALSKLAFTGEVGNNVANYVYANNNGAWAAAGKISFLLGTDTIPWNSGSTTLYHGGDISISQAYSAYSHFLWNAPVQGYDIAKGSIGGAYNNGLGGGYINGFSGGIFNSATGEKSGWLTALYLSTDRTQAGWLTGPIASTDPGAWMGQGTLTKTVPETQFGELSTNDVVTVELGSLTGKLAGSVGTGEVMGTMAGSVPASGGMIAYFAKNGTSPLPWGIYNLKFGGNFADKPSGGTTWTAKAGGAGSNFGSFGGGGYWLGTVANGTWSAAGELNGGFSGSFLTPTMMGTLQGPFYGVNGINGINGQSGNWIGESIGTYTGTRLNFSSPIEARESSNFVLSTFTIPTSGAGRWWDVAVVTTQSGVSSLYRINTINDRTSSTYPAYSYTRTLIGAITTPVYFRLTWGASPSDLDSHAWIPATGGNPSGYHVYYSSRGAYSAYPYAYLDQDIMSGYGPEVISFSQFLTGDTFYSVYNWSGSPGIWTSGAIVEILYGSPDITPPIFNAYFGGTDSLFTSGTGPIPVSMMGQFRSASSTGALWHAPLYSYNSQPGTYTTYDGGAYRGYLVGTKIGDAMSARTYALYVAPRGGTSEVSSAGYLKGSMTGTAYPDIEMFSMDGSLYKTEMTGNMGILPEDLYYSIYSGMGTGSLAATLGTGGFSGPGDLKIETQAIRTATTTQPWGIYKFTDFGAFTNPGGATAWTGKAGGSGVFGAYTAGSTLVNDAGYWLAGVSGGWTGGAITGELDGRFLTRNKWGTMSGDVLGVYNDSNQTWQGASLGVWDGRVRTLAFSSALSGDLYQVIPGKIVSREYQRPYYLNASTSYSRFDPLKYEVIYFMKKNADGSYAAIAQPRVLGFEQIQRVGGASPNQFIYKDEYHYYPNNRWLVIQKGKGITRATGSGLTSSLDPVPVLSSDLPVTPFFVTANIFANTNPGTTSFAYDKYVKSFESAWLDTNASVWNGSFTGILGGLQGQSLWTSTSAARTSLLLMGSHDAYSGSQVFDTNMSYSLTGAGAFVGQVTGIIRDVSATGENPLEGLAIGIYVDAAGMAGILKGNIAGTSYEGINMWESNAATMYRDGSLKDIGGTSVTAATLLATGEGGGYTNIFRGAIGAGVNSGIYGTFDSAGAGYIKSPLGVTGHTVSLVDQPNWGYFDMKIGAADTYSKPEGSSNAWTASLFGSGMFGRYGGYADGGYFYADLTSGAWADNRLSGALAGEFLTFKKKGTLEGLLLGTYDGAASGSWQATSVGTWQKSATQDVYFSSEIWGKSYMLAHGQQGSKSYGDGYYYQYSYNDQGEKRYGSSEYYYSDGTNRKKITRFDIQGPPTGEKGHKDVWVQNYGTDNIANTADDTWTFQTTVYETLTAYYAAMELLQKDPANPSLTVTPQEQWDFHTSSFGGIMAGLGNLWANLGTVTATPLFLMGDSNIFDQQKFDLFGGRIVSFDPLLTMDPFSDSRTPAVTVGENTAYRGAYYGFLGGNVNSTNNTLSGFFRALYMDNGGKIGLIYTDAPLAGTFDPNVGMWKAGGNVYTYQMFNSGMSDQTTTNFASGLMSRDEYRTYTPEIVAENVAGPTGSAIRLGVEKVESVGFSSPVFWGLSQITGGGSYSGSPTAWSMVIRPPVDPLPADTTYVNTAISTANNTFSGTTAGATVHWQDARTSVMGGEIKGVFDPVAWTWKAVTLATQMETGAFLNKVNAMGTDDAQRLAFQKATNIPAFQVGQANLEGCATFTGGGMSVAMSNVTFFAPSSGGAASIWASAPNTGGVTGTYSGTPAAGWAVPLTQQGTGQNVSGLNANFQLNNWNANNNAKWGATVNGGGTVNSQTIGFTGGAAGTINPTVGSFSGSAAGIVTPPQGGGI